eukprot:TRINITY_DN22698_c0_g1_i1.p1 TRINITY_DN22698_c0_g1~~TRINITY_DN22698_c0_g1_i1.p1  ORF type:complete len:241 (-),score=26.67 TRINITY_DN22698_c0_g1_i1:32-754(-)
MKRGRSPPIDPERERKRRRSGEDRTRGDRERGSDRGSRDRGDRGRSRRSERGERRSERGEERHSGYGSRERDSRRSSRGEESSRREAYTRDQRSFGSSSRGPSSGSFGRNDHGRSGRFEGGRGGFGGGRGRGGGFGGGRGRFRGEIIQNPGGKRSIQLSTNHFNFTIETGKQIFQYSVRFLPTDAIEPRNKILRRDLVRKFVKPLVGDHYFFDGSMLFGAKNVDDQELVTDFKVCLVFFV